MIYYFDEFFTFCLKEFITFAINTLENLFRDDIYLLEEIFLSNPFQTINAINDGLIIIAIIMQLL